MSRKIVLVFTIMIVILSCASPVEKPQKKEVILELKDWKSEVKQTLKLFGHRNWIVIADGAYPQQSNPAIKTITIDANQIEAVDYVNQQIEIAKHVDANIFVDKEMAFVPEKEAKGIEAYRTKLNEVLEGKSVNTMLHEDIIRELDASAKMFNILIFQ